MLLPLSMTLKLRLCCGAQKDLITRKESYLESIAHIALTELNMSEVTRHYELLIESIQMYNAVQDRIEELTDSALLSAEASAVNKQRIRNSRLQEEFRCKIVAHHTINDGYEIQEKLVLLPTHRSLTAPSLVKAVEEINTLLSTFRQKVGTPGTLPFS